MSHVVLSSMPAVGTASFAKKAAGRSATAPCLKIIVRSRLASAGIRVTKESAGRPFGTVEKRPDALTVQQVIMLECHGGLSSC